ncbi:Mitochondrial glycoprotein [Pseudocohnilembus persalinus]|uniref:Mitochondrial glycoprotein n=1 Tax=Pseudocohnilembus persalinus TaxID=266149 RepID=A0A0V0Q872_PSEPJ|nr:Mitochondrial glycoprotein [Pseudocohnilembus persalinus]|eukprot:KRW98390.1 Mitochondrial glycoprotein [Pseudocohnilembus persalinus]
MIKRFGGLVFKNYKVSKALLNAKPTFNFSTLEEIEKSKGKLFKAVDREYKFEQDNFQKDESIEEFLQQRNLKLVEQEDSIYIDLISEQDGHQVTVSFQSRSPYEEGAEEEEVEQQQQQQEEEMPYQDYCDFTVYIQKKGEGKALAYECSSQDSEINVHAVNLVSDINAHKYQNRFERITQQYVGPDFNTLDERLQTGFIEYLKSVGVDEELAAFVEHVSLDKEQRLYAKWLGELREFLC